MVIGQKWITKITQIVSK